MKLEFISDCSADRPQSSNAWYITAYPIPSGEVISLRPYVAARIAGAEIAGCQMSRTVFLENWHAWMEPTIDDVLLAAGYARAKSPEQDALLAERNVLQEMMRQVREIHPDDRRALDSPLTAFTARDPGDISTAIVERVGEIHDIYRRFRKKLVWPTGAARCAD